jgi:hypothetical protein
MKQKKHKSKSVGERPCTVPSLVKLSSLIACDHFNTQYAIPPDFLVNQTLSLPIETITHLFPFLHYRWVPFRIILDLLQFIAGSGYS